MVREIIVHAPMKRIMLMDGGKIECTYFTFSEFQIIGFLIDNMIEIVDKNTLLSVGWPDRVVQDDSLPVIIFHLRKKIKKIGFEIKCFKGRGYALFPLNENLKIVKRNTGKKQIVLSDDI
ncbi:winged helix-turn-helix domain-containing protein [Vibrio fluvialis]|nr:winged helix-turn-helix domain-containing protein [Vibrio fluvialis]